VSNEIVVLNKDSGEIVPFILEKDGTIRLNSVNPNNNDESCIVTVWDNLININKMRRENFGKKSKN
jgi:hypothetical protein